MFSDFPSNRTRWRRRVVESSFSPWTIESAHAAESKSPDPFDCANHYSRRTEDAYVGWIRRLIQFHRGRHPSLMGHREVTEFLSQLAVKGHVAASTQNQALSALLFLYQQVLNVKLPWLDEVVRARRPKRLPVVLTRDETRRILKELAGVHRTIGLVLYGSGLRLLECLRLRVKDVDFDRQELTVRQGKGDKDRRTMLASSAKAGLRRQIGEIKGVRTLCFPTSHQIAPAGGGGSSSPASAPGRSNRPTPPNQRVLTPLIALIAPKES